MLYCLSYFYCKIVFMVLNFRSLYRLTLPLYCISFSAMADVYITTNTDDAFIITNQVSNDAEYIITESSNLSTNVISRHAQQLPYQKEVMKAAKATAIEPALIHAIIAAESQHQALAISHKGAAGLMQLMPETAKRFNVKNRYNPQQNIMAGSMYLNELSKQFNGDLQLTIAAYNAGPGSVKKYGGHVPPYTETQKYVPKVIKLYQDFSKQ
jgi:soluble lytic murein transglycosylase-like protein